MQQSTSQQDIYQSQSGYGNFQQPSTVYVSGHFYDALAPDMQVSSAASDLTTMQGQVIEQQDGTYILQLGAVDGNSQLAGSLLPSSTAMDSEPSGHIPNTDVKFRQEEMQFLHDNFESAENSSMPRIVIYSHYTRFCRRLSFEPLNPASFGKLIRLVFAGIKTRRLGTRGNSKYHYYGIRIKPSSELTMSHEDCASGNGVMGGDDVGGDEGQPEMNGLTLQQREHINFLGDTSAIQLDDLPSLTLLDNDLLPEGITVDHLAIFEQMYKEHCQDILSHVSVMDLVTLPKIWETFWQNGQLFSDDQEDERYLSVELLHVLCEAECAQKYVRLADYAFYTILLEILIPDVLRPIPSSMTLVLRNFSKSLEPWLMASMSGIAEGMVGAKMVAANAFAQLLRRYTSLNHLAQAARTILQNSTHVSQMLSDLNKVDFTLIHEQAAWVCQCDDRLILQLEQEIKKTLSQRFSLEQWTKWLDGITYHILQEHIGKPDFSKAARQFILKWSFYSSLLLRDLTLRSATSFGSFHLIRLLFDEYMFYTIEHKVAAATGISPIAAFGDIKQFIDRTTLPPLLLDGFGSTSHMPRFTGSRSATNCEYVHFATASGVDPSIGETAMSGAATMADGGVMLTLHHHGNQYEVGSENVMDASDAVAGVMSD